MLRATLSTNPSVVFSALHLYLDSLEPSIATGVHNDVDHRIGDGGSIEITGPNQTIMSIIGILADMGEDGLLAVESP